ncbi:hypothetical protein HK096_010998 [Nowakowskiella sp. JEL0078]|nr:hypothetical protein HK096_010998 [Nowakowskiella sp. JEL0078]
MPTQTPGPKTFFPVPFMMNEVKGADPAPNLVPGAIEINVREFIQKNYTPYLGDDSFLADPTSKSKNIWKYCEKLLLKERQSGGCLEVDANTPSTITSHKPGRINEEDDIIIGLQTDSPLRRAIKPKGGFNMVRSSLKAYGYTADPLVEEIYTKHRKTHNDAVFDMYTPEMRAARSNHIITGLP